MMKIDAKKLHKWWRVWRICYLILIWGSVVAFVGLLFMGMANVMGSGAYYEDQLSFVRHFDIGIILIVTFFSGFFLWVCVENFESTVLELPVEDVER